MKDDRLRNPEFNPIDDPALAAPRPWIQRTEDGSTFIREQPDSEGWSDLVAVMARGAKRRDLSEANAAHAVACVNAIHSAGITPEALARDPECVAKLVEAARHVVAETQTSNVVIDFKDNGPYEPTEVLGVEMVCSGCGSDPDAHDPKCSRLVAESALRACGIEVMS